MIVPGTKNVRIATDSERARWRKVLEMSETVHAQMYAAQLKNANAAVAYKWGQDNGQPIVSPAPLEERLLQIETAYRKTRQAIQRVEDREWGISFLPTGAIAIVSPSPEQLSGWIIPVIVAVAVGAIVIPNIVDTVMGHLSRQKELINELNRYQTMTETVFCKQGSPETCAKWHAFAEASGYKQREEQSEGILEKIGRGIATGAKWGLGAGIALLAVGIALSMRRK